MSCGEYFEFPWPPLFQASALEEVSRADLVPSDRAASLQETADYLAYVLERAGYHGRRVYCAEEGFAIATGLERIRADGLPLPDGEQRWLSDPMLPDYWDEGPMLAMPNVPDGVYRRFVFVVSQRSAETGAPDFARPHPVRGIIPWRDRPHHYPILAGPLTEDYALYILVHEYDVQAGSGYALPAPAGRSVGAHLEAAGLEAVRCCI